MGNQHSQQRYSFQDQYHILGNTQSNSGLFKLQDRQNGELFIGRQLSCNDENEAYQLQCVIDQKLNNPSPFVTKLLKSQSHIEDSYCGNTHKYYLLFREVPKLLADQISQRKSKGLVFMNQEVQTVITRVSKGIKYLYDIYHDHNAISSKSITWPKQPKESIQLIDEWALNSGQVERKNRVYRPKDDDDINEKTLQKANDLYNLGLVAKQMMSIAPNRGITANTPDSNNLRQKIQILMSNQPQNRFLIYNMLNTSTVDAGRQFRVSEARKANLEARQDNIVYQNISPSQPPLKVQYQQELPKVQYQQDLAKVQYQHELPKVQHQQELGKVQQKNMIQFGSAKVNQQNSSMPQYQQFTQFQQTQSFPVANNNNVNAGNISINGRNTMSLSKANFVNSQNEVRNSSGSKVFLSVGNAPTQNLSSNKYSVPITAPQVPKIQNSLMVGQQVNFNQASKKTNVQFNNNSVGMSLSSPPSMPMMYNSAQTQNNTSVSFNNSPEQSITTKIATAPRPSVTSSNNANIIGSNNVSIMGSNSVSSSLNAVPNSMNISSSFAPLTSNINTGSNPNTGFTYSFGQSSDQTFSFKGLSNSDENLFTSPDFFSKIKDQNSASIAQQQNNSPGVNIQSVPPPPTARQVIESRPKADEHNTIKYSFLNNQLAYSSQSQSNLNSYAYPNKTPIQSLKPSIPLNQKQSASGQRIQNLPTSSSNEMFKDYKTQAEKSWEIPTISSVVGPSYTGKNNFEVFQNVTNIPITKSIENPSAVHQIFDKVASNNYAYSETPNIVVHQQSKDYDYVKTTPGKSKSNQPFSTIPQVSERSGSARSDDDRDFVIEQYQNGSRYEGFKSNGMRNGKGKFFYQEGSFYDGQWKNNNMHGFGKLYYSNNKLAYEGQWFIDQFHGKGKVYNDQPAPIFGYFNYTNFENLDQKWKYYEGDLVCDSKEGQGKLVLSNDQYYEGQFRNDKIDGKGKFVAKNGQTIKGIWEDSKLIMKL